MAPGGRRKSHAYMLSSGRQVLKMLHRELGNVSDTLWYGQSVVLQMIEQGKVSPPLDVLPLVRLSFDCGHSLRLPACDSACTTTFAANKSKEAGAAHRFLSTWSKQRCLKINYSDDGEEAEARPRWPKTRMKTDSWCVYQDLVQELGIYLSVDALVRLVFQYAWVERTDIIMDLELLKQIPLLQAGPWWEREFEPSTPTWCQLDGHRIVDVVRYTEKSADRFWKQTLSTSQMHHTGERTYKQVKTYYQVKPGFEPWD